MPQNSKRTALLALVLSVFLGICAQSKYPEEEGDRARFEFVIEMPKAYVSGILIMAKMEPDVVSASLVNEFGFSLMDFTFDEKKQKVKLISVTKKLDKWYIKRTLRGDLKKALIAMRDGENEYYDKKHKIKFTFIPINDPAE